MQGASGELKEAYSVLKSSREAVRRLAGLARPLDGLENRLHPSFRPIFRPAFLFVRNIPRDLRALHVPWTHQKRCIEYYNSRREFFLLRSVGGVMVTGGGSDDRIDKAHIEGLVDSRLAL